MDTLGVSQQEAIRLHWIRCKQQTADGEREETLGAFEGRGSGMTAFGWTVANKQAGNVACNEMLIELGKQTPKTLVSPALVM